MCTENYHWHHDYIRLAWDSGFAFNVHRTKTSFDWSNVGILDIDRIIRDRDVALVEKHMGTVLNYSLDEEQTKILEPTFVKLFQLGQLSLQYLQFCKRYLDNTVILLKKELGHFKEDNSKLKETIQELKNEISNLKKRVKELKQCSQFQTTENALSPTFICNICSKLFVSEEFLIAHVKRRHEVDLNPFQTETDKLQLEIKELKERLNSTEKLIQNDNKKDIQSKQQNIPNNDTAIENTAHVGELKDKFEHLRQYVERELTLLRNEKHYQEKYEKWFEMVFQKLDSSKNEFQGHEDKSSLIGDGDKLMHKESSTQTIPEIYVESETMTDEVPNVVSEENIDTKPIIVDFDMEKIQNDIKLNTVNHLDQVQGILEKKLSGGFEQIQNQMNFFWKKLGDMELDKKQNAINIAAIEQQGNSNAEHPVLISNPVPNDNHHINSSSHNINSNDSFETPISKKTQPVPAPRIVKAYSTTKYSRPKVKTAASPIKVAIGRQPKVIKKYQTTSSEDTSSEEIVEIIKAPVQVTPAKNVVKSFELMDKLIVRPKLESKYIKTYRSKATEELSNSETEEEEEQSIEAQPQLKRSTTSTLGQRSLTSLKQMIKDEDVMKGLNVELHEMVNLRLKEIGISPQWTGIPDKSYKQAIRVVNHQTDLSRKKYPNYNIIREVILKILSEKVKKQTRNIKSSLERSKQKEEKKSVTKQVLKKRTKQERQSKYPLRNTFTLDVKSEDKQIKPNNTYTRRAMDKDIVQVSSNIQEKSNLVGTTPVKKKVLFDLEDSSSTSKVAVPMGVTEVAQGDNSMLENKQQLNFQRTFIVANPGKKDQFKDVNEPGKISLQKSHNQMEIHDDGESTTTLASSISERPKLKVNPAEVGIGILNVTKDDISDWDISDILT